MDPLRALLDQLKKADAARSRARRGSAEYRDASAVVDRLVRAVWHVARSEWAVAERAEGHRDQHAEAGRGGVSRRRESRRILSYRRHVSIQLVRRNRRSAEPGRPGPQTRRDVRREGRGTA
jgi:hypothetical protein